MTGRTNLSKSKAEYTRAYENLRGVDFSETGGNGERFAYLENMYVDYDGGADAVETVPGFRKLYGFGQKINAIHLHNLGNRGKFLLVHSGTKLYRFNVDMRDKLKNLQSIAELEDTRSHAFNVGDDLYVMDGKSMIKIDSSGTALRVADDGGAPPHVPTTYKNEKKTEEYNLLNRKFVQKFDMALLILWAARIEVLKMRIIGLSVYLLKRATTRCWLSR